MRDHGRILGGRMAITHRHLVEAAERCADEDLRWLPGPTSPPIGFHLWHCGRWADRWAEAIGRGRLAGGPDSAPSSQRWEREGLAARWGFPSALGGGDTGMELPDEEAAALPWPAPDALAAYLRDAFGDLERAVERLDDAALLTPADDLLGATGPVADSLVRHLSHVSRHLGMVEALRGMRGGHGTATV